ncbi:hypothetical protein BDQ12DRAFT_733404 [Crucibulum laeve]|uniref:FMR1-interacting protein 1 conserved domain-containing protein n=1 Tax=Crucibulum laeve TaxID=68775 RepID=A0A5C3M6X0_9AGAR|nr:hypothetical protein BDQ12DRAFT_733404 [Crucibulum laeve]
MYNQRNDRHLPLPRPPHGAYSPPQPTHPTAIAHGIAAALSNPYAYQQSYSSHYAQAYIQSHGAAPSTTPEGYTLSSSYNPASIYEQPYTRENYPSGPSRPSHSLPSRQTSTVIPSHAQWYQPGTSRCTYKQCSFSGSRKALEIHMMDRHLIYPPGWENRKTKPDWDADPSLKGKPILIQGTTITLDSPDVLDAWIAERRKRWPSSSRVDEKQRKMEEALARGQLPLVTSHREAKRRRVEGDEDTSRPKKEFTRGRARGRGQAGGRHTDSGWKGMGRGPPVPPSEPVTSQFTLPLVEHLDSSTSSAEDDDNDAPEVVSSKPPPEELHNFMEGIQTNSNPVQLSKGSDILNSESMQTQSEKPTKPRPTQPKKPLRNPFASRPTLLRNLLLPEIRMTISNLSQAIRFLVDNDFLEGVELKPGEGAEKLVQVIDQDATTACSS